MAALERRLALLQSVLQDATAQRQDGRRAAAKPAHSARVGGPAGAQAGLQPAGAAGPSVLPANTRWELRVITGRGAHSSGGEASIPRAVEARLVELGYKFVRRTGALDVLLRRPFGSGHKLAALAGN